MEFRKIIEQDKCRVILEGEFLRHDQNKFEAVIGTAKSGRVRSITLDFNQVVLIDSAALGMLLTLQDNCSSNGISIALLNAKGQIKKMFDACEFSKIFDRVA